MINAAVLELINFEGQYEEIPEHMRDAIMNYILHRMKPGVFLEGVICNDLRKAVCNADAQNLPLIKMYVWWFYNICPSSLVGEENYRKHLAGAGND